MSVYFELHDLMHAKGDVGIISSIISETIRIHKLEHCHDHKSNESLELGDDHMHDDDDDIEHGYYDEDEERHRMLEDYEES